MAPVFLRRWGIFKSFVLGPRIPVRYGGLSYHPSEVKYQCQFQKWEGAQWCVSKLDAKGDYWRGVIATQLVNAESEYKIVGV